MVRSMEIGMRVGTYFEKWRSTFTRDEIKEIEEKYRLSPEAKMASDRVRQIRIAEAVKLIDKIIEVDGPDITSMNLNNAMRYLLVTIDSRKYCLDITHARDDNCIQDLMKQYGVK